MPYPGIKLQKKASEVDASGKCSRIIWVVWVAGQCLYRLHQLSSPLSTVYSRGVSFIAERLQDPSKYLKTSALSRGWGLLACKNSNLYFSMCYKSVRTEPRDTEVYEACSKNLNLYCNSNQRNVS